MAVNNPKDVFVQLLSNAREGAERSTKIYRELGQAAQHPEIKEALEARALVSDQILTRLDEAFKLLGEKPMKPSGRMLDIFVEDFRRELSEIQSPEAKRLFILVKVHHLIQLRTGEYAALAAAADLTGHPGVGVLLETSLADTLAFVERTRRFVRELYVERERIAA